MKQPVGLERTLGVVFGVLLLFSGCTTSPDMKKTPNVEIKALPSDTPRQIDTLLVDLGEYDKAIDEISFQLEMFPESATPGVHYSLALAYFKKVESELPDVTNLSRLFGSLKKDHGEAMLAAHYHFMTAAREDNTGSVAPRALYMAGQTLDLGRLQRFDEAMDAYRECFERFPVTESARRSRARFELLEKRFKTMFGPDMTPDLKIVP
jgi:tetratricopeptide (TPR) repeat protein